MTDWTYNNIATNSLSWLTRGYTGHEHLQQFGLINMNGRLYDPILGRMLSPDNYTQGGSQGYNRYSYAMNNPLKYTDPSGQTIEMALLGAGIGALANVAITGLMGRPITWNTAWQGAKIGAAIGLGLANVSTLGAVGKAATRVVLGVVNSYLPSLNIPISAAGTTFTLSVSPAFAFGSGGLGLGANFSFNIETPMYEVGFSFGITGYAQHGATGKSFFESRMGWNVGIGRRDARVLFGGTSFGTTNGETSQKTSFTGFRGRGWSLTYENDGYPFTEWGMLSKEEWSLKNANGYTDAYRTAAVTLTVGDFSVGTRIFTGFRDFSLDNRDRNLPDYPNGRVDSHATQYLSGVLYAGYQNFRVGYDHYMIGHGFQNILAHTWLAPQPRFDWKVAPNRPNQFYGDYISKNPNTNW